MVSVSATGSKVARLLLNYYSMQDCTSASTHRFYMVPESIICCLSRDVWLQLQMITSYPLLDLLYIIPRSPAWPVTVYLAVPRFPRSTTVMNPTLAVGPIAGHGSKKWSEKFTSGSQPIRPAGNCIVQPQAPNLSVLMFAWMRRFNHH